MATTERPPRRSLRTLLGGRNARPAPRALEDDPLAEAFPMRRGIPAFLFSAVFHAALLVLLATISFAVVRREERINVKLDPSAELNDAESEGAPSLHEIAGSLHPVTTAPRAAGSVTGPSTAPAVAAVRAPEMPRVAGIGPRDKGDEYVTKWVDFSFHTEKVQNFVAGLRCDGGGDYPEAVKAGVQAAIRELSWRKTARRILIVIGGSPPHKEDVPELTQLVRTFKEKNGAVGAVDVSDRLHVEYEHADWVAHGSKGEFHATATPEFYHETSDALGDMAHQGGGEILRLGENKALLREVMALTFGTRWRVEMARYMDRLQ